MQLSRAERGKRSSRGLRKHPALPRKVAGRDDTLTDSVDVATVLDHVHRDVVIVHTFSGRVDALEVVAAISVLILFACAGAAAT